MKAEKTIQDIMRERLLRCGDVDTDFSVNLLLNISCCESCSAPFDMKRIIEAHYYDACICPYCKQSVVKNVYFYFPEGPSYPYVSITSSLESLIIREKSR